MPPIKKHKDFTSTIRKIGINKEVNILIDFSMKNNKQKIEE